MGEYLVNRRRPRMEHLRFQSLMKANREALGVR
jgi:hypothetical protein